MQRINATIVLFIAAFIIGLAFLTVRETVESTIPWWLAYVGFVVANGLDLATTLIGIRRGGIDWEQNAFQHWIGRRLGLKWFIAIKVIFTLAAPPLFFWFGWKIVVIVLTTLFAVIAFFNLLELRDTTTEEEP